MGVPALAGPDRQRRAPVALAGKSPVDHAVQEVAHAAFLDVVRNPVDAAVKADELVAHGGHADKPALPGVIDQRRIAAPAEGIAVLKGERRKERAPLLQVLQHLRVRILDEHAVKGRAAAQVAGGVHKLQKGQLPGLADAIVVLAEGGGDVYHARAVGQRNIAVGNDAVALLPLKVYGQVEQRPVFTALQLTAAQGPDDFGLLPQYAGNQRRSQNIGFAVLFRIDIVLVRVHAERNVGGQRPGRGRPREDGHLRLINKIKLGNGGGFFHILVALRDLVAGQRRAAARAVGDGLVAFVEQALFIDLLQRPPLGLDIVVLIGHIGVLHVRPEGHAVGHLLPLGLVFPDGLFAFLDEGLHAVGLNLLLAVQTQQLFHLQLHGQAVGIPARLAQHVVALHGFIARNEVLDGARFHMPNVRAAVGGGRPVEEGIGRRAPAQLHALFKNAVLLPEGQRLLLAGDEVQVRGNFFVHAFSSSKSVKIAALFSGFGFLREKKAFPPVFGTKSLPFRGTTLFDGQTPVRSLFPVT